MVRTKDKKAKGDDAFKAKKQKVGRKKLAPSTATKAEVHARTLRVDVQKVVAQEQAKLAAAAAPPQAGSSGSIAVVPVALAVTVKDLNDTVNEQLVLAVHFRAGSRKAAFAGCLRWLQNKNANHGLVAPVRTMQVLDKALNGMVDTDNDVRVAARDVVHYIMTKTFIAAPSLVPAVASAVLRKMLIAITHAEKDARVGCVELLGKSLPTDEEYWLEGLSEAQESSNFLGYIVHSQPALRSEAIQLLESVVGVAKATKTPCWGAVAAVARCFVSAPRCFGGELPTVAGSDDVAAVLVDVARHTFSLFKELTEMRQALFGFRDKLHNATCMAHAVGTLMAGVVKSKRPLPFDKPLLAEIRAAFVESIPFSFVDLCARGTAPALRFVVAVMSVSLPLMLNGASSVIKHVVAAGNALSSTRHPLVATFTVHLLQSLLDTAATTRDGASKGECLVAAVNLVRVVPSTMAALLQGASNVNSGRTRDQCLACVRVIKHGLEQSLFTQTARTQDSKHFVLVDLVKTLFLRRDAQLDDADVDTVVIAAADVFMIAVCSRTQQVSDEELALLRVAVASLFGMGDARGIARRCSTATQLAVAALSLYLGASIPADVLPGDDRLSEAREWIAAPLGFA